MINYKGSQFQTSTNDSYHDESYTFTEEDGFQLAFGIPDLNDHTAKFEDYFDVAVFLVSYNLPDLFEYKYLETQPCSESELGLDESTSSKFYSMSQQDKELTRRSL